MEHIYHFAHIGLETWETEPIKVIIGVEIWFLVSSHRMGNRILYTEGKETKETI